MANHLRSAALAALVFLLLALTASAQFPIRIPKVPKPGGSGSEAGKKKDAEAERKPEPEITTASPDAKPAPAAAPSDRAEPKRTYENVPRTSKPVLMPTQVFIELVCKKEYWKMPNDSNVTSWLPKLRLSFFYDERVEMQGTAEYYNPDGSLWFTEPLEWRLGALRSKDTWTLHDTKSTNAVGSYSVKVKDTTGAVIWKGRFKVRKYPLSDRPAEKNKLGFSVEEDWLLPLGVVAVNKDDLTIGALPIAFSVWLKGAFSESGMNAELLHNGKVVAQKQLTSGAPMDSRESTFTPGYDPESLIRRWEVSFSKVFLHNGNWYNEEWFREAHFIDRNPGDYVFKLYRNGTQIREFAFTVGADGRFVRPPYSDDFMFPQHGILLPAKVLGNMEKWNQVNWKADMFFGNPLPGF